MNNQLVKKDDVSIFDKIRAFFKGLFSKNNKIVELESVQENNSNEIKAETSRKQEDTKSAFIKVIEKNPDRVDNLTDDVLDRLIRYYRRITSSKKAKIKELRGD